YRLVVEEGARAAAPAHQSTKDDLLAGLYSFGSEDGANRMARADIEAGGDACRIRPRPDQRLPAARAQREAQSRHQDGFPRPGFPGQRRKPVLKLEVERTHEDK